MQLATGALVSLIWLTTAVGPTLAATLEPVTLEPTDRSTAGRGGLTCEGTVVYQQQPDYQVGLLSQEDPCQGNFIRTADNFIGDGFPISGFRWWGVYQHQPGQPPETPDGFFVEIFESTPEQTPGALLDAAFLDDFEEIRDPENNGLTSASYCIYLQQFFETNLDESYYVSITPQLCTPDQWGWITSNEGDGNPAYVLAPELGYVDWTPTTEVYGEPLNCSMHCTQPLAAVDITFTPELWMPEFLNTVTYNSKIYWLDPRSGECVFPGPPKIIQFRLFDPSKEKGICLNKGLYPHTDLHLNTPENFAAFNPVGHPNVAICDAVDGEHDHWELMETKSCVVEATLTVKSEDYGSWGWLEVTADGCNAVPVENLLPREVGAPTSCTVGPSTVLIPVDLDGNHIADIFSGNESLGNNDPMFDEETLPNPESTRTGDGLTRYEEYRGVLTRGTGEPHDRLSPRLKEIGVYRQNTAWQAEDIHKSAVVIDLTADQMNGALHDTSPGTVNTAKKPRIVNFNRTSHTMRDQHGLWLAVGGSGTQPGHWGQANDENGFLGRGVSQPPGKHGRIDTYSSRVTSDAALRTGRGKRILEGKWVTLGAWTSNGVARGDEFIKDTIGHELGHGHGIVHHQDVATWMPNRPPSTATIFYDVTSQPVSPGRRTSLREAGLTTCVMQYNFDTIRASLQLVPNPFARNLFISSDPNWTNPTKRHVGYGATCTSRSGQACNKITKIRDN